MKTSHSPRYGSISQLLHWLTAILVLVAFVYGPGGGEARVYAVARDAERQLHETLGLAVLGLSVLRILWRLLAAQPAPEPMPEAMRKVSAAVQGGLYLLLLAVPLSAVAGAWLEGHALTLLGGLQIAPLLAPQHALGAGIATLHTWLGDAILWLAGAHAAAALYHHHVRRDGVLLRMLPHWIKGQR